MPPKKRDGQPSFVAKRPAAVPFDTRGLVRGLLGVAGVFVLVIAVVSMAKQNKEEPGIIAKLFNKKPEAPPPPIGTLQRAEHQITKALGGAAVHKLPRVTVNEENGTLNLHITFLPGIFDGTAGPRRDVFVALRALDESGHRPAFVHITGTAELTDTFGKTKEESVVDLIYGAATLGKIGWARFDQANMFMVADQKTVHGALLR